MTSKTRKLFAHVFLPGQTRTVPAGRLGLIEDGPRLAASTFVYGDRYRVRDDAIEVDPVDLPLAPGPRFPSRALAHFGAIRDATPDMWGRRVIEAKLRRQGALAESDYLLHGGHNRVGALDFSTTVDPITDVANAGVVDLDHLRDTYARIEAGEDVPPQLERLLDPGASMGGARPKATVLDNGQLWLAKFASKSDRFDIPAVEAATLELAREAGLRVPATRLVKLADRTSVLLVARFDRLGEHRVHFVSALTLLAKDESESLGSSYLEIVEAMNRYGDKQSLAEDRVELFARMLFNILVSNDDDHLRNHGFIAANRDWRLSPLYDVVPHPQASASRSLHLAVGNNGREATIANALTRSAAFGMTPQRTKDVVERVTRITRAWKNVFEQVGVSGADIDRVASAFVKPRDIGG